MDLDTQLRQQMREEMRRQGLTQAELARRLGVQPPTVAQVVNGRRGHIPRSLVQILDELGLTLTAIPKATLNQSERNVDHGQES